MKDKSQPLHIKYRPVDFEEFVGNESVVDSLKILLSRTEGRVKSFLFHGPSGTGKTTLGRIVASKLDCDPSNLYEYNVADVRGIDTIRDIIVSARFSPLVGSTKVYLLDEAHKLTGEAQNALLKFLEDTPKHVAIILCTTEPEKLIKTVRNRCSEFQLKELTKAKINALLTWVCNEEKVNLPDAVVTKIIECSEGCPRKALVLLDQVIDITDDATALDILNSGSVEEKNVLDLCQALLSNSKWSAVVKIKNSIKGDPEKIRMAVLTYMEKVMDSKGSERASDIWEIFKEPWFYCGNGLTQCCFILTKNKG